jgi:signal transduction histidine kinase
MVSPLWLGNVLLVSVLLLVRRQLWPVVLAAGLAGFLLYDLQSGAPIRSIVWLILSNTVEVLIAALCLNRTFHGPPRLNSVKALVKYSFYAVFLAPFVGAFFGALASTSNYWSSWKVAFFSEAIGFLALMPAILGWAREIPTWAQKSRAYYLEAITLLVALVFFGLLAFAAPGSSSPRAMSYSIVPLLLWSTLRFGSTGVGTSMIAIAFLSIWGAVHSLGPFVEPGANINVVSMQEFLFFTAAPFMALAALVEERKDKEQASRQREADLTEAQRVAKVGSWKWDPAIDAVAWSAELYRIAALDPSLPAVTYKEHAKLYTAESWQRLRLAIEEAMRSATPYELDLEMVPFDGTKRWVTARGEAQRDSAGRVVGLRGTVQDITERKLVQEKLREKEETLSLAVQAGRMYAFEWDAATDVIVRSGQCVEILSWLDDPTRDTGRQFVARIHPEDRAAYAAVQENGPTPGNPFYHSSYRVLRPDASVLWLEANGRIMFDDQGRVQRMVGLVADVTERKLAEQALSSLSSRLIHAQEQECARIARELHDDLSQRIALISVSLQQVAEGTTDLSSEAQKQLRAIAEIGAEASSTIHNLSHQLHPSKLEILGLVASLKDLCREFSKHHHLEVQLVHHDFPRKIPIEITLCLFRIAQEALRNVVKHSGAAEAKVEVSADDDRIDLSISDCGVGFRPEAARGADGLGLISMRERLRTVRGHLSIESKPAQGTRIYVRVPWDATNTQGTTEGKTHRAGA